MNSTAEQYEAARRPLAGTIEAVPATAWDTASPCQDWSARDVVAHLIETQRELLLRHDLDLGDPPDSDADPTQAWSVHSRRVSDVIADAAVPAIAYDGYFGPTTLGSTLVQFYVWDMYVHRWDIARAAGVPASFSAAELDRIEQGADSFGDALYLDGICQPALPVPERADRTVRVLARLGRAA